MYIPVITRANKDAPRPLTIAASLANDRGDVASLRVNDCIEERCELLQRVGLLIKIGVAVIHTLDSRDRVAEHSLRDVRPHTRTRHKAARRASEIMERPMLHAGQLVIQL